MAKLFWFLFPFHSCFLFAASQQNLRIYDAKSAGHHGSIKAEVEKKPFSFQSDVRLPSSANFSLVCGRRSEFPVIGTCRWNGPLKGAKFDQKQIANGSRSGQSMPNCGCETMDANKSDKVISTLNILGSRENIIILGTSPVKVTANVGSPVTFWIEYTISILTNESSILSAKDDHTMFISHWYNTMFSKGSWHRLHSFHEPLGNSSDQFDWTYRAFIRIDSATVDESGLYTFEINNGQLQTTVVFVLHVHSDTTQLSFFVRIPQNGKIDYDPFEKANPRFVQAQEIYEIVCAATMADFESKSHNATIELYRSPCSKNECKENSIAIELSQESYASRDPINGHAFSYARNGRYLVVVYKVKAIEPSIYSCVYSPDGSPASDHVQSIRFIPTEIENAIEKRGLEMFMKLDDQAKPEFEENYVAYEGDQITLECRYQNIDYRFQRWQFFSDQNVARVVAKTILYNSTDYVVARGHSYATDTRRLTIRKARLEDSGKYICELLDAENFGKAISVEKRVIVISAVAPKFEEDSNRTDKFELRLNETDSLSLSCLIRSDARPTPVVSWSKNGQSILPHFHTNDTQKIHFHRLVESDSGNYSCRVENRAGSVEKHFLVNVSPLEKMAVISVVDKSKQNLLTVLGALVGFVLALMVVVIFMATKSYRRRKRLNALHQRLINLTKDNVLPLDPQLPINQQVDNLPYDPQYEIPKENLVLGKRLGEGQFGQVLQGYILSRNNDNACHVAVKMPKDGMDLVHQKMLLSEFKIMAYVGNHVNVISLIAAVTCRMPKGELYVAMEYCENGSLRDYLIKRRSTFQNEPTIFEKDGYLFSKNSPQRIGGDEKLAVSSDSLTLSNLIQFSYQIANGMDYLASKNIVHRDLALRNILLTKDMLVKIGDFGLALNQWEEERRNSKGETSNNVPLPFRWMALESILYGEFSVHSDVWSFGIVLWEIFSLCEIPYSGKAPATVIGKWLIDGNRLAPPNYSPEEIYHLMTLCWLEQPNERPSFSQCRHRLGIELQLRTPNDFEALQNLINSYHSYVNFKGALVSDDETPNAPLLGAKNGKKGATSGNAIENREYNFTPIQEATTAENLAYTINGKRKFDI